VSKRREQLKQEITAAICRRDTAQERGFNTEGIDRYIAERVAKLSRLLAKPKSKLKDDLLSLGDTEGM